MARVVTGPGYRIYDEATPLLQQMLRNAPPSRPFFARMGRAVERLLKQHFTRKGQVPNQNGWPRTFFWTRRIRNSTALDQITEHSARVTVADPAFAAKVNGATVRPREKKFLAIPTRAESYGKWPSSGLIPGLFVIGRKSGRGLYLAKREGNALRVFYRLLKKAVLKPDPTALPPASDINAELERQASAHFARFTR